MWISGSTSATRKTGTERSVKLNLDASSLGAKPLTHILKMTSPLYKQVLVIGATSGIGKAMANRLVKEGSKVVAVGRRQNLLDAFVRKHGKDKTASATVDIGDLKSIPGFVQETTSKYPDIDCVYLNAGVQYPINLSKPAEVDRKAFEREIRVNYLAFVHLTLEFLPFLENRATKSTIIYTGSNLSIIPAVNLSGYSASKAALNAFVLCLRQELAHANSTVKIVEISPPVVQTELHDYMGPKGKQMGMPAEEFIDAAYNGLVSGSDQIVIGDIGGAARFNNIINERRAVFEGLAKIMQSH